MYVCLCKGVTDTQIRAAAADGADSLRAVRERLGVSSQCGKCVRHAVEVLREVNGSGEVPLFRAAV